MKFIQPRTWAEALAHKADEPNAVPILGGTDVMVEINFDRHRPVALLDLGHIDGIDEWTTQDGRIRLGAGVSYARIIAELSGPLPGLAMASRTVGSPQIRNRGTVTGNLGSASPAGDAHPALLATQTDVELSSVHGVRLVAIEDFYVGVKRSVIAPDELITGVIVTPPSGPQQFSKIGTRNAMVISVSAFSLALHPATTTVGTGIGSAAPTPRRAPDAEQFLGASLTEHGLWESRGSIPPILSSEFGRLVAAAAAPIDDVRGTARYRLHALSVMARRSLGWAWNDYQKAA